MRIKDKRPNDRPREKLKSKGAAALSDFELLQALIGSGNKQADVATIARRTKKLLQKHGPDITYEQLQEVTGLGVAKITELLASLELSKRYLIDEEKPIIDSPEKAAEQLKDIRNKKQEHFVVMTLDGANRLIEKRTVTMGTLTASLVHPREVFAYAIGDRAACIIVGHNHPSGNLEPSKADKNITDRLMETGRLVGIELMDHLIISTESYYSILKS